jgi:isoquinoline 1-oxidoreductase beta subunit
MILSAIGAGIFKLGAMRQSVDAKALLQVADEMPLTVTASQPSREDIVRVVQSPGDEKTYGNQDTDGSRSVRHWIQPMRHCGAAMRQMLETAAAATWDIHVA